MSLGTRRIAEGLNSGEEREVGTERASAEVLEYLGAGPRVGNEAEALLSPGVEVSREGNSPLNDE